MAATELEWCPCHTVALQGSGNGELGWGIATCASLCLAASRVCEMVLDVAPGAFRAKFINTGGAGADLCDSGVPVVPLVR